MKPKAIVIASGKSLLDKPMGKEIDSFDIVLRFMGLPTDKDLSEYIGKKTDIYMFNLGVRGVNLFEKYVSEESIPCKNIIAHGSFPVPDRVNRVLKAIAGKDYKIDAIKLDDVARVKNSLGIDLYPSSGLMAVDFLLKLMPCVCVHGFDSLAYTGAKPENYVKFYSDDKEHYTKEYVQARHNYEIEAEYMRKLEKSGKLVQLSNI